MSELHWFSGIVQDSGFYYFAENPNNWDLAPIVQVEKITRPTEEFCRVFWDGQWKDARSGIFTTGLWCGPLPKRPTPNAALLR